MAGGVMTQRNRECKVQVQAPRVSARIAALTVLALALALTQHSVTPSDHEGRSAPTADDSQPRDGRRCSTAKRNARRFQSAPIFARCRRNPRHSRANRPRQMERMGIACIQNRKTPTMERARRIRLDRTAVSMTHRLALCLSRHARVNDVFSEQLVRFQMVLSARTSPEY